MKLFLLTQDIVDGYDTYDSCVVCAKNEQEAREMHPSKFVTHHSDGLWMGTYSEGAKNGMAGKEYETGNGAYSSWVHFDSIDCINVEYLGETDKDAGVICASFNAG